MTLFRFTQHHRHGFTIIEGLFGIALLVLFSGALWSLQRDYTKTSTVIQSNLVARHEVTRLFKMFSAEVRTASPSSLGAYPIVEATAPSFTFYADGDNDGLKERLRYFYEGTTLKRGFLKPTGGPLTYNPANETVTTVVRDVTNGGLALFSYYDAQYDGTTAPLAAPINVLDVRLVKLNLVINKNGSATPAAETYTTQVSLRNLKDNY